MAYYSSTRPDCKYNWHFPHFLSPDCLGHGGGTSFHTELTVETFSCVHKDTVTINGTKLFNGTFNPFATVFFASGMAFKVYSIIGSKTRTYEIPNPNY